jgi:hypothetical protein
MSKNIFKDDLLFLLLCSLIPSWIWSVLCGLSLAFYSSGTTSSSLILRLDKEICITGLFKFLGYANLWVTYNNELDSYIKGTQAWEFLGLRFWTLYFFIVSYASLKRLCKKFCLIWPFLEEIGPDDLKWACPVLRIFLLECNFAVSSLCFKDFPLHSKIVSKSITYVQGELFSGLKLTNLGEISRVCIVYLYIPELVLNILSMLYPSLLRWLHVVLQYGKSKAKAFIFV